VLRRANQLRLLYEGFIFSGWLSTNANYKIDYLDEKHDGKSKPETQQAANA